MCQTAQEVLNQAQPLRVATSLMACRRLQERIGARPPAGPKALVDQRTKRGLKPGQLDPETAEFAHRARELAGRRSYLKNFWYAAGARPAARL